MKILKSLQSVYEYLFAPWEITIHDRGTEDWIGVETYRGMKLEWTKRYYTREYIEYKYSHRFRKEEKIVKVYLN